MCIRIDQQTSKNELLLVWHAASRLGIKSLQADTNGERKLWKVGRLLLTLSKQWFEITKCIYIGHHATPWYSRHGHSLTGVLVLFISSENDESISACHEQILYDRVFVRCAVVVDKHIGLSISLEC